MEEEKLVKEVSRYTFLYDKSHPKHSNKHYVGQAWKAISSEVNCTVAEAKRKWTNLRDYFRRQLREEHDKSAAPRKKKWILFDKLSFLTPFMKLKDETEAVEGFSQYENVEFMSLSSSDSNGENTDVRYDEQCENSNEDNITAPRPVPVFLTKATPNAVSKSQNKTSSDFYDEASNATCKIEPTASGLLVSDSSNKTTHVTRKREPTTTDPPPHLSRPNLPSTSTFSYQSKPTQQSDFTLTAATRQGVKRKLEKDGVVYVPEQDKRIDDDDQFFKSCAPMVKMLSPVQKLEFRISVQQLLLKLIRENSRLEADTSSSNP